MDRACVFPRRSASSAAIVLLRDAAAFIHLLKCKLDGTVPLPNGVEAELAEMALCPCGDPEHVPVPDKEK